MDDVIIWMTPLITAGLEVPTRPAARGDLLLLWASIFLGKSLFLFDLLARWLALTSNPVS